ncbi:alpha/beta-hydrolase [Mycena rebaudengoi]|nr:alpha/beta-hydrolase [Mycena rebaudengoi]
MVALAFSILLLVAFPISSWAAPAVQAVTAATLGGKAQFPPMNYGLLCAIPMLQNLCPPKAAPPTLRVTTPLGVAQGVAGEAGANRFAVKYASSKRWAASMLATKWELPNGSTDVAALPLACPQPKVEPSTYSEDCLSMLLYVPTTLKPDSGVPTIMWVHGGSFTAGSATGPGLDGSKLAIATNSIVAVMQYRLGALGFMSPDGSMNLAVKDTINAMNFLSKVVPSFGGKASQITLAGQSSGAGMIRALLATPSASSLFQSAILQSDPMNYGFLNVSTQVSLQSHFNDLVHCSAQDKACQAALSVDAILDAQVTLTSDAPSIDESTGIGEPIRPVRDGALITNPLDLTAAFPSVQKPLLLTNVKNEAAPTIYGWLEQPTDSSFFAPFCQASLGADRTALVAASPFYNIAGMADTRVALETLGTDYIFRCPTWSFSRSWVSRGGKAFVGMFAVGATYPSNSDIAFCVQSGSVCHEDDIEIVAFLTTGNPNAPGLSVWAPATSTNVHAQQLGASGEVPAGACDPSFWGAAVQYDYQVYGI